MNRLTVEKLEQIVKDGWDINSEILLDRWAARVTSFLRSGISPTVADEFHQIRDTDAWERQARRIGYLEGLITKAGASEPDSVVVSKSAVPFDSRKLFIVHGHDAAAKESLARFLEKVKLEAIILHEQPSGSRTIIEKFETYAADVGFAVVLLTPDDVGCAASDESKGDLKPRARQNVITELGFFIGKLGRRRVCALYKGGVELPSDYSGVLYVPMDDAGAWKQILAQELIEAQMSVHIAGLFGADAGSKPKL